jgi:hypothetical protein
MNDLAHASLFLLIFALALVLYGLLLAKTGNRNLMPYRATHSIRNKEDVRRVGRIVVMVGLVLGAVMLLTFALAR